MSGFGGAFAAAMVGIVFIVAISSMTSISVSYMALYPKIGPESEKLRLSIDGGRAESDDQAFLLNLTLLPCSQSVGMRDLSRSDVFIAYLSGGKRVCERLEYGIGWKILNVTVGGSPEFVNPVRGSAGMWDPGETLEIALSPSLPIDANSTWYFRFAAYDGSVLSMSFGG